MFDLIPKADKRPWHLPVLQRRFQGETICRIMTILSHTCDNCNGPSPQCDHMMTNNMVLIQTDHLATCSRRAGIKEDKTRLLVLKKENPWFQKDTIQYNQFQKEVCWNRNTYNLCDDWSVWSTKTMKTGIKIGKSFIEVQ